MSVCKVLFHVVLVSFIFVFPEGGVSKEFSGTYGNGDVSTIPRYPPRPDLTPPFYVSRKAFYIIMSVAFLLNKTTTVILTMVITALVKLLTNSLITIASISAAAS